jgi:hypothetical protein
MIKNFREHFITASEQDTAAMQILSCIMKNFEKLKDLKYVLNLHADPTPFKS